MTLEQRFVTEPPVSEPDRQHFYIARAGEYVREESNRLGRVLSATITTFGCQMNARDSEKLAGILRQIGFVDEPDEEKADFVIFNTCTVRENEKQGKCEHARVRPPGTAKPHQEKTAA